MSGRDEAGAFGGTHKEQIVCAIRMRFGSLAAFERAHDLPRKSVSEELRKRCSQRVRDAIEAFLREEAAARAVTGEMGSEPIEIPRSSVSRRVLGWRSTDPVAPTVEGLSPSLLRDGFIDPRTVRAVARRMREDGEARRRLIVRRQAELLVELVDHSIDRRSFLVPAFIRRLHPDRLKGMAYPLLVAVKFLRNREGHGDLKSPDSLDPRLRLAERIFELAHARFGHPDLPSQPDSMAAGEDRSSPSHGGDL